MAKISGKHINIGKIGESIACSILKTKMFSIIERNYRLSFGEIDIIAKKNEEELVFFEVKTLINKNVYQMKPEDNLTSAKLIKLKRVCSWFANQHQELINPEKGWRIDLLAISINPETKTYSYNHYENIG